ncbi:MAG TPA: helix-turn-helix transcriptional regulator [Polyangia bacterium]|nr:helix-turn-helix transcriptional regulator [Polyangia bacterium]
MAAMLRLYRRDTGQSLETVSSAIGISAPTLFWIEHGRPLSLTTYQALWRWMMEQERL